MVFGRVRERARERKEEPGGSEREQGGSGRPAGVVHAARSSSASRRWPRGRAREHAAASGRGEEDDGELQCWAGSVAGWAGRLAGPHR